MYSGFFEEKVSDFNDYSSSSSSSSSSDDSDADGDSENEPQTKIVKLDGEDQNDNGEIVEEEEEEGEIRDQTPMNNPMKQQTNDKQREESPMPWAPKVYSSKFKPGEIPEGPVNRFLSREPRPKPVEETKEDEKEEKKDKKKEKEKEKDKEKSKRSSRDRDERDIGSSRSSRDSRDDRKYHEDRKYGNRNYDDRRYNDRRYDDRRYDDRRYDDRRYDDRRYDDRYGYSGYGDYRSKNSHYDRETGKIQKGRGKFRFRRSVTPPHWRSETKTLDEALGKVKPKVPEEREVALRFDTVDRKRNFDNYERSRSRSRPRLQPERFFPGTQFEQF